MKPIVKFVSIDWLIDLWLFNTIKVISSVYPLFLGRLPKRSTSTKNPYFHQ